jgi:hypothetical protein
MLIDAITAIAPSDAMTSFFAWISYWLKQLEEQGASKAVIHDEQQHAIHICTSTAISCDTSHCGERITHVELWHR